ncbi:peptidase C13 family-domain-containing protein [Auriculariales sp. MPI-PUGE-AT-0066]|nr:peptidase C13 family-domain-containing protein [Auriculariales sp. MPI-PUGE-AT-0066]
MQLPATLLALSLALTCHAADTSAGARAEEFFTPHMSNHTNNWAVLVSTSKYWFNYRHAANTLGLYRSVKRLGIPDSNIIMMLADDAACNTRNSYPGAVYANAGQHLDLYGDNVEVDYRGYEVTVENLIRLLTGRVEPGTPRSKRLLSDDRSNVFLYLTGHGGEDFLKFQDQEEISSYDLADAVETMWQKKRYNELFLMVDSCQAVSMYSKLYSPNVLATASSRVGENSYSVCSVSLAVTHYLTTWQHHRDSDIGIYVIDAYTHFVLNFLEGLNKTSDATMQDLFSRYNFKDIKSNAEIRSDLFPRALDKTRLTDFFGGVAQAEVTEGDGGLGDSGSSLHEATAGERADRQHCSNKIPLNELRFA